MNVKEKIKKRNYSVTELVEWLDLKNPTILYLVFNEIATRHITDSIVVNKLYSLASKLDNQHKMLGYYKIGHISMSVLLSLGIKEKNIFNDSISDFDKETVMKFYNESSW